MLRGDDRETFHSIRLLRDIAADKRKPLLFWVGSGASAWNGYPLWNSLAESVHREFLRYESQYNANTALDLIKSGQLPDFFSYCRSISTQRYHSALTKNLAARRIAPVYERFISVLSDISPCYVLTTNVDSCLESSMPGLELVDRHDIERLGRLIQLEKSFVCKLHGTISRIDSMIFTTEDYDSLVNDMTYTESLVQLLSSTSVIFLGYSLADEYVMKLLERNVGLKKLFGDGPHFLITSKDDVNLPKNVHPIRYMNDLHSDHRSAISVADIVRHSHVNQTDIAGVRRYPEEEAKQPLESAYYISDLHPPGTWKSSHTLELENGVGGKLQAIVGTGFIDKELPYKVSEALHDLVVGLICFDRVYIPLSALSKVHDLVGGATFWILINEDVLRLVHYENGEPAMLFSSNDVCTGGSLGMAILGGRAPARLPIGELIDRHLKPVPGHEDIARQQLDALSRRVVVLKGDEKLSVKDATLGALLHPHIRELLGLSDSVLPTDIPRWNTYPVLRLAHVIMSGSICEKLNIAAIKIHYGGESIAGSAFSAASSKEWADDVASYVASGNYGRDLGFLVGERPEIIHAVLGFRNSQSGVQLRSELLKSLSSNNGGEVVAAISAGLKQSIPVSVLQSAREELSKLMIARPGPVRSIPAVWSNQNYGDAALKLWRARSAEMLEAYCKQRNIAPYDRCPCGSGEKLKFCCWKALKQ
jgi:hypothetical protein